MITISLKEIVEEAKEIIRYIAGRRNREAEDYFRATVCEADSAMLMKLAEEAATRLALQAGQTCEAFSTDDGMATFSLVKENVLTETAIRQAMRRRVVSSWFMLIGSAGNEKGVDAEDISGDIFQSSGVSESGRDLGTLSPRTISVF